MLNELTAGFIARLSGSRAHPLTHAWSATRWISQNAELDADDRVKELLAQISAFNAAPRLNAASLNAFLLIDASAGRSLRELTETYLAGNRTANKAMLKKIDDAARALSVTYELFLRAHKLGKPAIRKPDQLAQVLLGIFQYRNIQNRVRLFRYDEPLPTLWPGTNSMFRYALTAGVHRLPVRAAHRDGKMATIESEYASLLLQARLSTGSFTAQEIDHASLLLDECWDKLRLRADEPAHATFALETDSGAGLVSAHGIKLTERTLFLDPEPLFGYIRKRVVEIASEDTGDALKRKVRVAWLERLMAHWSPDKQVISRRGDRQSTELKVALVPGMHNIHRELLAEMENAGEFWDTLIRTGRWRIVESSQLDCRIQFENESADQYPVGALVSIRKESAADWQAGVVRRVKRFDGNRIELGVEMIAREVKAIKLWPEDTRDKVAQIALAPESAAMVALYLPSTGAIPPAPPRAMIIRHSDYKHGLLVYYVAVNTRVSLKLGDAIETGRGWVWAEFTVEGRTPQAVANTDGLPQGLTTQLPPRSRRST